MTIFHRFCTIFPLFLLLVALSACSGMGSNPWNNGGTNASRTADKQVTTPYGTPTSPVVAPNATLANKGLPAVKVAILLPLSGPNAAVGQSMLQAAQLAVFDIGYDNFELMPQDTQGTAQGATAAATAAISGGAQLILGPLFAEEVRAVKPVAAARGLNVLAFSTDWTLSGGNTYIMGFTPFVQVERIAAYAAAKGIRTTAVAAGTDQYSTTTARAFEGETQKNNLILSRALSDATTYESVFIPASGNELTAILQRVTNKSAQKLGTGLWDDPRVAALPDMNGAWFAAPSPTARAGFESRYQSIYSGKPVRIASLAYDATALAAALAKAGFAAGKGPAFDSASLKNPNGFAGVDGIMRFNSSGLIERGMAVLSIQGGKVVEVDPAPTSFKK